MSRLETGAVGDLKAEVLQLKRQIAAANSENQSLKVTIRKMQEDVNKKDKQIEILLNPEKSSNFRKLISDKGAIMILNLKNKVEKLEKTLAEKNAYIKKVAGDKQVNKIFGSKRIEKKASVGSVCVPSKYESQYCQMPSRSHMSHQECQANQEYEKSPKTHVEKTLSQLCANEDNSALLHECEMFLRETLSGSEKTKPSGFSKKSSSMSVQTDFDSHKLAQTESEHTDEIVPEYLSDPEFPKLMSGAISKPSDNEWNRSVMIDSPLQKEIMQLHSGFQVMLAQFDYLKSTIRQVRSDQLKTEIFLQRKDLSMEKLTEEVKSIRKNCVNVKPQVQSETQQKIIRCYKKPSPSVRTIKLKSNAYYTVNGTRYRRTDKGAKSDGDKDSGEEDSEPSVAQRKVDKIRIRSR